LNDEIITKEYGRKIDMDHIETVHRRSEQGRKAYFFLKLLIIKLKINFKVAIYFLRLNGARPATLLYYIGVFYFCRNNPATFLILNKINI